MAFLLPGHFSTLKGLTSERNYRNILDASIKYAQTFEAMPSTGSDIDNLPLGELLSTVVALRDVGNVSPP